MVEIGDQRGHGVGDQTQVFFAAAQGGGDALIGLVGGDEALVRRLQLHRALGHAAFEFGVLLLDLLLVAAAGGDVGVERDKTVVRQRLAAHGQNLPAGAFALGVVRLEAARQFKPRLHQHFDIAGAVFAALGVVAHEGFKIGTHKRHAFREIEQAQKRLIPRDDLQVGVDDGQALVEAIQPGLNQLVAVRRVRQIGRRIGQRGRVGRGHGVGAAA